MPYLWAICHGCGTRTIFAEANRAECEKCGSPFFWYARTALPPYWLTEQDRVFLRKGGIKAEEDQN